MKKKLPRPSTKESPIRKPPRALGEYRRKRDFRRTAEPPGEAAPAPPGDRYVMHKHAASHDHYDLRLEQDGVLRSWALPKGPSLARGEKRLAVEVDDHPIEYGSFEGTIPKGEYGGGTVMLWDTGTWRVTGKLEEDQIDFALDGVKLRGRWTLVRTRAKPGKPARNWLLIKRGDASIPAGQAHDRSILSGRSMDEIARRTDAPARGPTASGSPPMAAEIHGARRRPMPDLFAPQLATRARVAPAGDEWLHEIKFDGYRMMAHVRDGRVRLLSRNGHDWTRRLAAQAADLEALRVTDAILDGELVALAADGATSFRTLQERISARDTAPLIFEAFDLVHLDGYDLTAATLVDRKAALQQLLVVSGLDVSGRVRFSDHVVGNGQEFFDEACALGLEGSIAKRADGPYRSGRTTSWLKLKRSNHGEFVVGGYTPPSGARKGFGALLLGAWDGDAFRYAGRVGTGFSDRQLRQLHAALRERRVSESPFSDDVPGARGAVWVNPERVVDVEYTERTRDGRLRHPTYRGLREDRSPEEITMTAEPTLDPVPSKRPSGAVRAKARTADREAVVEGVEITHPDRVVYPEQGVTKLALARYYADVQDWLLPYLANRLLSLVRCPEGRHHTCFYQKHLAARQAPSVPRQEFRESKGVEPYAYVQSIAHVIALVQNGVLEFHPFGSQIADVEHPDMMVLDLDPSPGVPWRETLRAARTLRQRLDDLGLPSFVRTTGGKGLHVVVPLRPTTDWEGVKAFAKAVSERHAADDPQRLTTSLSKAKRRDRIYLDYLRNSRGATAIACYSTRARPGAPVAVPLRWDELGPALHPDRYTVSNLRRRLGALDADPWGDFFDARASITMRMRKAVGLR
ncbi:MAG TPA: DNA ligase D [Methylomirabilota bacterium]|nr:DNA ligase D [Methylomirabilota bacterium]